MRSESIKGTLIVGAARARKNGPYGTLINEKTIFLTSFFFFPSFFSFFFLLPPAAASVDVKQFIIKNFDFF